MSSAMRTLRATVRVEAFAVAGYTGSSVPANSSVTTPASSSTSWYSGFASCTLPLKSSTLPAK